MDGVAAPDGSDEDEEYDRLPAGNEKEWQKQCYFCGVMGSKRKNSKRGRKGVQFVRRLRTQRVAAMRQWLYVSPNPEYILVNVKNGEPMTSLNITQALTRIFKTHFNKNVSTTLLRHIVLTEKFGKQLQEMEAMADVMGHNISTAQSVYIKNVDADA